MHGVYCSGIPRRNLRTRYQRTMSDRIYAPKNQPQICILVHRFVERAVCSNTMNTQFLLFPKRILSAILVAAVSLAWASASAYGLPQLGLRRGPRPLLVGYFSNSTIYSSAPFYVKHLVTSGSAARLDQINYASASVKNGRCSLADPVADLLTPYDAANSVNGVADDPRSAFHGYFHQIQEFKRKYPRLKILISLEGTAAEFAVDRSEEAT